MSFLFSTHSLTQRATLHPDLQKIVDLVIGFHDFRILEGFRGEEAQNKAFDEGKSKLRFPASKHNKTPSEAMDLLPFVGGKPIAWEDREKFVHFAGMVQVAAFILNKEGKISHGLRWGGDWGSDQNIRNERFFDLPHFELSPNL